ncbi:MAG: ABC transporter permease [Streptosporangiales bacterium]|nr:ABC transporter permease [Streptosporangiales bacterium]
MSLTYLRVEIMRQVRDPRTLIFTVAMPSVLFLIFSNTSSGELGGISSSAYLMVSMAAYGSIGAAMFSASGIALERRIGWNRQLRLTPLPPQAYVLVKGTVAWLVTLVGLLLVYLVGLGCGVDLTWTRWLESLAATWLAVLPFVLLGIGIGYVGKVDLVQPVTMIVFLGMSIVGGLWVPVQAMPDLLAQLARVVPSYWLGAAGRAPLGAPGFGVEGVLVLAAWAVLFGGLAAWRYRADTTRV